MAERLNDPLTQQREGDAAVAAGARKRVFITGLFSALLIVLMVLSRCSAPGESGAPAATEDTASHGSPESAGRPSVAEPASAADTPIDCEALGVRILRLHPTRDALQDAYGAPDSTRAAVEPNRHVPQATDSLFVVHYPGLEVHIRTPAGGGDMVSDVVVRDGRYIADPRFSIGAAAAEVRAALGEPATEEARRWTYECGTHVENPVTFEIRGGRVASIAIAYYVD